MVFLALTITETCMKNCGVSFASNINKSFMDEMVNIARGSRGPATQDEALKLIQSWGKTYIGSNSLPIFYETFSRLRARGIQFPPEADSLHSVGATGNSAK